MVTADTSQWPAPEASATTDKGALKPASGEKSRCLNSMANRQQGAKTFGHTSIMHVVADVRSKRGLRPDDRRRAGLRRPLSPAPTGAPQPCGHAESALLLFGLDRKRNGSCLPFVEPHIPTPHTRSRLALNRIDARNRWLIERHQLA